MLVSYIVIIFDNTLTFLSWSCTIASMEFIMETHKDLGSALGYDRGSRSTLVILAIQANLEISEISRESNAYCSVFYNEYGPFRFSR